MPRKRNDHTIYEETEEDKTEFSENDLKDISEHLRNIAYELKELANIIHPE